MVTAGLLVPVLAGRHLLGRRAVHLVVAGAGDDDCQYRGAAVPMRWRHRPWWEGDPHGECGEAWDIGKWVMIDHLDGRRRLAGPIFSNNFTFSQADVVTSGHRSDLLQSQASCWFVLKK